MAANTDRKGSPLAQVSYSNEQVAAALHKAEAGTPIVDITPKTRDVPSNILHLA
jgi:hypothetical protein